MRNVIGLAVAALTLASPAFAGDTVTEPFPGITYTHRTLSSPRKEIHILEVDLTRPQISLRTTKTGERGRTTTSFADLVGAAVAVNGDFYNVDGSFDPNGLAIGEGVQWADGPDSTGSKRFIACTATKECTIDTTGDTIAVSPDWRSAVGGRRALLKPDGFIFTSQMDVDCGAHCTTLHPRTAVGLKDGGNTMVLVVVEGRQDPIFGLKISGLAQLMESLGCEIALELDGGGSSTMVIDGARVSGLPDGAGQRAVANHLAIIFDPDAVTTARLEGFVRADGDEAAPIVGATVALSDGQTSTTDVDGAYEFAEVEFGVVGMTVTKEGFLPFTGDKDIELGVTNEENIALVPAPPEQPAEGEGEAPAEGEGEGPGDGEGEAEGEGEDASAPPPPAAEVTGGCASFLAASPLALAALFTRRRRRRA